MKILIFEWRALGQDDLEDMIAGFGIEIQRFMYQFQGLFEDDYFIRNFGRVLKNSGCDAVFSWNFWPLVADACFEQGIPYIAWVYDCPIDYNIEKGIRYPTSHLFLFDKDQCDTYTKMGGEHIYHLPLAVNSGRIDEIRVDRGDKERFSCDVSFLGTMYEKDYAKIASLFSEYERGYVEALIDSQQNLLGAITVNSDTLPFGMCETIRNRWLKEGVLSNETEEEFQPWLIDIVLREVTKRDRIMMLSAMGTQFKTKYYSYKEHPLVRNAEFCGSLDYYSNMYKMFRLSRINLNITSRMITKGISLRALDIMAAGGFLLSNWQEELVENFVPGEEFACYESIEDAVEQVGYYLEHEEERQRIAEKGHSAVRRFDYKMQLDRIFSTVFPEWTSETPVQI